MRTCDHSGRVLSRVLMAALIAGPITAATTLADPSAVQSDELAMLVNDALGLRASHVEDLIIDENPGQPVIGFVSIEGTLQVLHLEPYSVRSDNYQLLVQGADGEIRNHAPGPVRTLRGSLLGVEGSVVAGSMLDDGLHARIVLPSGSEFWVEPLRGRVAEAGDGAYVVYRTEDVLPTNRTCALDAIAQPLRAEAPLAELGSVDDGDPLAAGGLCTAELACDADFEYFQDYGSVAAVEARINSVINTVNLQYSSEVGITLVLTTIIVRTAEPDPYTSTDSLTLLNQFRNHWLANHGDIQRDTAELFTGKDLDSSVIGIAWLNAICTSLGFSVAQSDFNGNFSCATDLTAHELGHNWGANHCSCSGYTMNPFITCANQFHPTSTIPEIIAFRDSRTCIDCGPPPPPTGACCVDGSCSIETEADCTAIGGVWQGAGTDCLPNPCGGEIINLATADYATDSGSISGGSYLDTQAQDDVSEALREQHTGGPPSNRRSLLAHTWTFNVAAGESYGFFVDAFHTGNNEGDDFAFSYSLDDLNYAPMLTITKIADDDVLQSFAFVEDIAGVLFVRVEDTDGTPGNGVRDTIFVDEMFIVTATEGGDTTPPSAPTGLTAIGGDESVTLDWLDNTEPDLDGYNVYRSTTSGGPFDLIALLVLTSDYVDTVVMNGTTYFYVVTAVDLSGNESADSSEAPATPQPPGGPATNMHVDSIVPSIQNAGGGNKHGRADVIIVDNFGNPVAAALVIGTFSGDYNETQSATTNSSGMATILTTITVKGNPHFTFCVDDVTDASFIYNPAANLETCDTR